MIVKSERFLCSLVIDDNGTECGVRFKDGHKIEAKPPLECSRFGNTVTPADLFVGRAADQFTVIIRCKRITLRDARDLRVLVIGWDEDVIRLLECIDKTEQLIGIVIPIDLQVQVTAIDAAERIITIHAEGQRVIVIRLVGDSRTINGKQARVEFKMEIILLPIFHHHGWIELKRVELSARVAFRGKVRCQRGGGKSLLRLGIRQRGQSQLER